MEALKLNFIKDKSQTQIDLIEKELRAAGEAISHYAKKYFYYFVSTSFANRKVNSVVLWILILKIGYNYQALTLQYQHNNMVKVKFHDLGGQNIAEAIVFKTVLTKTIVDLFNSQKANDIFEFLVEQVEEDLLEAV